MQASRALALRDSWVCRSRRGRWRRSPPLDETTLNASDACEGSGVRGRDARWRLAYLARASRQESNNGRRLFSLPLLLIRPMRLVPASSTRRIGLVPYGSIPYRFVPKRPNNLDLTMTGRENLWPSWEKTSTSTTQPARWRTRAQSLVCRTPRRGALGSG